jgi:glutaconate CoA-transferase, subunit B
VPADATTELLIAVIARLLRGVRHVATGASSPIPGAAALLARAMASDPMYITVLGSTRHTQFTNGGVELFDLAAQGRLDAFFLSGGQIDGAGNINLVGTGPYPSLDVRWSGSFGSAYLYFLVPRVILFREEHTRRVFVPKVDFVSAPGSSSPGVYRRGGPHALVTSRCLFAFDRDRRRFRLESVHDGHTVDEVVAHTGFDFDLPAAVPTTPAPNAEERRLIYGVVREGIAETYPRFANRLA